MYLCAEIIITIQRVSLPIIMYYNWKYTSGKVFKVKINKKNILL